METKGFPGNMWPQLLDLFPKQEPVERSSMNSWEDGKFVAAVKATGRKKLVMAALWTEVCLAFPALEAVRAGYEVYAVEDASGGTSVTAHNAAIGLTSLVDAGGGSQIYPDDYAIIEELHKRGELTVRMAYNIFTQKPKEEKEDFLRSPGRRQSCVSPLRRLLGLGMRLLHVLME